MTWNRVRSLLVVSCIAAFLTAGCGQGSPLSSSGSLGTVVGPTALMADGEIDVATTASLSDPFNTLGGKGEKGKGKEQGRHDDEDSDDEDSDVEDADDEDSDAGDRRGPNRGPGHNPGSLSGFVTAVSATTITVRGVVVTVPTGTPIRHGHRILTMANIQVGDKVQVKGTATTTATGTAFTATEIKVEDMDRDGDDAADDDDEDDDGAKVEGKISGLTGTCPALTFNVVTGTTTTTTTKVTTNAQTKFEDVLCTGLADNAVVEVKGTKQTDGSILATKIELE